MKHFYFKLVVNKLPRIFYIIYWPVCFIVLNFILFIVHFVINLFRPLPRDDSPFNAKNIIPRVEEVPEQEENQQEINKGHELIEQQNEQVEVEE